LTSIIGLPEILATLKNESIKLNLFRQSVNKEKGDSPLFFDFSPFPNDGEGKIIKKGDCPLFSFFGLQTIMCLYYNIKSVAQ